MYWVVLDAPIFPSYLDRAATHNAAKLRWIGKMARVGARLQRTYVLKAKLVFLIRELQQVQNFGGGLVRWEGRRLVVVDEDGNAAVRVEA